MLERILIVGLVAVAVVAAWGLLRLWSQWRLRRAPAAQELPELAGVVAAGRPAVLAFSTPGCAECRSLQAPALKTLGERLHDRAQIAHLSVPEYPDLVQRFGILTVPATVILDSTGIARHVNLRYTSADRLEAQLSAVVGSQ